MVLLWGKGGGSQVGCGNVLLCMRGVMRQLRGDDVACSEERIVVMKRPEGRRAGGTRSLERSEG